jgi:hypothetical protein
MEKANGNDASVFIAWKNLKAAYRGKEMKDAPRLSYAKIKRMSLIDAKVGCTIPKEARRLQVLTQATAFFGTPQGDFSMTIDSICALVGGTPIPVNAYPSTRPKSNRQLHLGSIETPAIRNAADPSIAAQSQGFLSWLVGECWKL